MKDTLIKGDWTEDYLVYLAYNSFLNGDPISVDVYAAMTTVGMSPERILERFCDGEVPPLDNLYNTDPLSCPGCCTCPLDLPPDCESIPTVLAMVVI